MKFKPGDKVWFISKYGDKVDGVYDGTDTIPGLNGPELGHIVVSDNAFGPDSSMKGVRCVIMDSRIKNLHLSEDSN